MTKKREYTMDSSDEEEDTDVAGGSSSTAVQLKPHVESIFAEVEKNLPSIDFDLSDVGSDNEEPIFHRNLKLDLDDEKDLDTSEISGDLKNDDNRYDLDCSQNALGEDNKQKNKAGPLPVYDNDIALQKQLGGPPASGLVDKSVGCKTVFSNNQDNDMQKPVPMQQNWVGSDDEPSEMASVRQKSNSVSESQSDSQLVTKGVTVTVEADLGNINWKEYDRKELKVRKKQKQEKSRQLDREVACSFLSPSAPQLSIGDLENVDIDSLLYNINSDNRCAPVNIQSIRSSRNRSSPDGSGEPANRPSPIDESGTLIERLAQLSMTQSGEDLKNIDPRTGAQIVDNSVTDSIDIYSLPNSNTAAISSHVEEKKTSSCGTSTSDISAPPKILYPRIKETAKCSEPETVFIDVRNFEEKKKAEQQKIERVQQILRIQQQQSSSDSSDSEDDNELWFEKRRRIKQALASRGTSTELHSSKPTVKDDLSVHKTPNRVINLSKNKEASNKPEKKESEVDESSTEPTCRDQNRSEAERERQRRIEEARKQRDHQENERQSRIRLAKRLEVLRPTLSTSTRQPAAEATPVIYDVETSYEPSSKTLPSNLSSDHESLLLTVHLTNNGEIVLHRNRNNKSVDTGVGLSASYTTLLTWLLSLVPDNFDYLESGDKASQEQPSLMMVPFHVIGLQQLWMDEQLCLVVAVTPPPGFDSRYIPPKVKKSKMRDEVKDNTPFQQHLFKFLSTNTLHKVCPWLQDLVSMEVPCAQKSSDSKYVYQPPLPNITSKPLSTFVQVNPNHSAAEQVFNAAVGFFWHTVDSEEHSYEQNLRDSHVDYETQNTMSLVYKKIFHEPRSMMGIFNRVLQEGLDLAGVRLLYPTAELLNLPRPHDNVLVQTDLHVLNNIGPLLAVAIRGTFARTIWLDAVGPSDPALARRTDPNSLCALYGGTSRDECLLFCPRNPMRVQSELSRWFGGRVPPGGVIDIGTPQPRKEKVRSSSPKGRKSRKAAQVDDEDIPTRRPPAALAATTKSEIFFVMSPLISSRCLGIVMSTCQRRGYQVRGVKRVKLNLKKASVLGITGSNLSTFCPGLSPSGVDILSEQSEQGKQVRQAQAYSPVTVLLLEKENAAHNTASLIEACMVQMTLQGIMGAIQSKASFALVSSHLFHSVPYSENVMTWLGGDFSKCPERELQVLPSYVSPYFHSNPEEEQMVILVLTGHDFLKNCGIFVAQLLNLMPYSKSQGLSPFQDGFELLGVKWHPHLTASQAKEVTSYEVGDKKWKDSIRNLSTEPAIVLLLRGIDAFSRMQAITQTSSPRNPGNAVNKIISNNAEETYTFTTLFFTDKELYGDTESRSLLHYSPMSRYINSLNTDDSFPQQYLLPGVLQESIYDTMLSGPRLITSILIIKPTAVHKHLHKIMKKLVQEGFLIVGFRLEMLTEESVSTILPEHVSEDEDKKKHIQYLMSGPVLCLCVQRENAVKKLLDILGPEDPQSARRFSQFLWRGVFGSNTIANGFHGSTSYLNAVAEIKHFFSDGICCQPTEDLKEDEILCPAVDSIIDLKYYENRDVVEDESVENSQSVLSSTLNLMQTTCLVLLPPLFKSVHKSFRFGVAEIFDGLVSHGFGLVAGRMVTLTKDQAEQFLHVIDAGSFQKVPLLTSGPCLVIALQRDNAVITFDSLLGGSIIGKYGDFIIRPSDTKVANNMLAFFFDHLMPGSHLKINVKTKQEK